MIDLGIGYREDPEQVTKVLQEIGAGMQADPKYGTMILAPLEVFGVNAFGDWAVQLQLRIKTVPQKQWEVGRELRRRILKVFQERGIEMPSPERIVARTAGANPVRP